MESSVIMSQLFVFIILYLVSDVSSYLDLNLEPCKDYDEFCVTTSARALYNKVVEGEPSIGLKGSDPMFKKHIQGNLFQLNYTLTDSSLTGFRDCEIVKAKLNLKESILRYELVCPFLKMVGNYDAKGILIIVPIEGNGDYLIEARDYRLAIDIDITFVTGEEGKQHVKFKSFRADADLKGGLLLDLRNLFNGNKEFGDAVLKFANQNWRPVSKVLQGPVVEKFLSKLFSNFNKMCLHIPVEDLIIF